MSSRYSGEDEVGGSLEQLVWRMMTAAAVLPVKVAYRAVVALLKLRGNHSVTSSFGTRQSGSGAGVLCPGSGPPPPGVDLLDYRGVADISELQPLWNFRPSLGRFYDCRMGPSGQTVGIPPQLLFRHAAVVGPAGSGKTVSVIVPWIADLLRLGCSVVAVDVKGDLLGSVKSEIARQGSQAGADLYVWDFSGSPTHRWNWLDEATGTASIEAAVTSILGRQNPADPQPHFYKRDVRWLRALIRLVKELHSTNASPQVLISTCSSLDALTRALAKVSADRSILSDLADATSLDPMEYSQAFAGILNALSVFTIPEVANATKQSDFRLKDLTKSPALLMCVAPQANANLSASLSSMLITQVVQSVYRNFGTGSRPVYIVLDESPRLRDRVDLEELVSLARSANVGVCLAAQDITQFPESERASLFNNCQTFIAMPGVSPETAKYLENRMGMRSVPQTTTSRTGGSMIPTVAATTTSTFAPVLGAREIMHPPFGAHVAVAHVPPVNRRPFLIDLER